MPRHLETYKTFTRLIHIQIFLARQISNHPGACQVLIFGRYGAEIAESS
jgi:hypothetical protein